jgi:glutaredoxin
MPTVSSVPSSLPAVEILTVYGADWCVDCARFKRYLEAASIPYRYVDLEDDPAAQERIRRAGLRSIPVIVTPEGRVLVEPTRAELDDLRRPVEAA